VRRWGWSMSAVLRWTGSGKLISFYRYFSFNVPRVTTASGIVLLLGVGAIRLYWLTGGFLVSNFPVYLTACVVLLVIAALLASAAMVVGRRPGLVRIGWALGSVVSAASIAMYVVSRILGLPGLPQLVQRWDYALGTFSMALAAMYLMLHFSVLTGMNVAYPERRQWHD
jgi:hypothetical protein